VTEGPRGARRSLQPDPDLVDALTAVLERHDPVGLVTQDPDIHGEEYAPEVTVIATRLPNAQSEEDARRLIHDVLTEWFDDASVGTEQDLAPLARDVWEVWNEVRDEPA
jgi:hypothetical protein